MTIVYQIDWLMLLMIRHGRNFIGNKQFFCIYSNVGFVNFRLHVPKEVQTEYQNHHREIWAEKFLMSIMLVAIQSDDLGTHPTSSLTT